MLMISTVAVQRFTELSEGTAASRLYFYTSPKKCRNHARKESSPAIKCPFGRMQTRRDAKESSVPFQALMRFGSQIPPSGISRKHIPQLRGKLRCTRDGELRF